MSDPTPPETLRELKRLRRMLTGIDAQAREHAVDTDAALNQITDLLTPVVAETDPADLVLELDLDPNNDSGATTVRGYLLELLATLWREEEGFSGKRPFGNSGWKWDLYLPMVRAGVVSGKVDEDGYLEEVDRSAADALIARAIERL